MGVQSITVGLENWQIRDSVMTNEIIPIIKKLAKKNKLTLINLNPVVQMNKEEMMADGVHPTPKGAAKMAKTVAEHKPDYLRLSQAERERAERELAKKNTESNC